MIRGKEINDIQISVNVPKLKHPTDDQIRELGRDVNRMVMKYLWEGIKKCANTTLYYEKKGEKIPYRVDVELGVLYDSKTNNVVKKYDE